MEEYVIYYGHYPAEVPMAAIPKYIASIWMFVLLEISFDYSQVQQKPEKQV